jgi:DNA-binding NtrC family response regulator
MSRANASILIVDDDEAIRNLLSDCLDDSYWCATAASAEEAIVLLASGSFNLVLSDITMPGKSGLDLCGYVQEACPNTAVVMISAMTDIDYAVEAMRQGAFDYITKPFDLLRVRLAVVRALRYQQAVEDKQRYEQVLEERVRIRTDGSGRRTTI